MRERPGLCVRRGCNSRQIQRRTSATTTSNSVTTAMAAEQAHHHHSRRIRPRLRIVHIGRRVRLLRRSYFRPVAKAPNIAQVGIFISEALAAQSSTTRLNCLVYRCARARDGLYGRL